MSEKLKPCPFCGEEPSHPLRGLIHCEGESCPISPYVDVDDDVQAIKAWNTRAEPITIMSPITTVSEGEPQTYVPLRACRNVSEADYGFKCSLCGDWEDIDHPRYCAHCGAKVVE